MKTEEIIQVLETEALPDTCSNADYIETPNSWVIRSDNHAFKIRKPVQENGTELSTAEQRKELCKKELKQNRALAGKTYEDVIPLIKLSADYDESGNKKAEIVDYALKMKRLPEEIKLFEMLRKHEAGKKEIREIASSIAAFHKKAAIVRDTFNITKFQKEYEEIRRCEDFIHELFGDKYVKTISKSIKVSKKFLSDNRYYIQERTNGGFIRDGHGNLDASKIFLKDHPLITDRLISGDEKRKTDVLFDIALLGISMDYHNSVQLEEEFLKYYFRKSGERNTSKTQRLYSYFKLYRTGQLITKKLDRNTLNSMTEGRKEEILRYFELLKLYMKKLKNNKTA